MRRQIYVMTGVILCMLFGVTTSWAQKQVRANVRQGNTHYEEDRFLESEIAYRKALESNTTDSVAMFNLGNSLFRQQKADDALEQYMGVARTATEDGNKTLAGKAYFNAGDVCMAAQQYDKALELFKQSLRMNPLDNDARYNMLLAQKLLKQQQQEQQQQEQQQQEQQQQEQQQQEQQQQEQQQQEQQQQEQQQQEQQQQEQQQQEQQMSQEQAESILKASERDEKETQEQVQEKLMQQVRQRRTDKDW